MHVVTPKGAVRRVSELVPVDATYDEFPAGSTLRLESVPWQNAQEGVLHVRSADGATLVFNDLLWTPPARGWTSLLPRLLRQQPQVPWLACRMFAAQPRALQAWLVALAHTPNLLRVVPGHGPPITAEAQQTLQRVAAQLRTADMHDGR